MEKKTLPENLAAQLKPEQVRQRKVRLCFQDEARFGRMVRFRQCWAPRPLRPKVCNAHSDQFGHRFQSNSDSHPSYSDSCRREATL